MVNMVNMGNQENGCYHKFCLVHRPETQKIQGTNLANQSIIQAQFMPMQCIREQCASHWCDIHKKCINICKYEHNMFDESDGQ